MVSSGNIDVSLLAKIIERGLSRTAGCFKSLSICKTGPAGGYRVLEDLTELGKGINFE
jgi:hypothetical protein